MARIVVIDGAPHTHTTIGHFLDQRHEVFSHRHGSLSADFVADHAPDLVFVARNLPDVDGIAVVSAIGSQSSPPPVICINNDGDPRSIVAAVRAGAYDVLVRPLRSAEVKEVTFRALAAQASLPRRTHAQTVLSGLVGVSPAMERVRSDIARVARSDAPVLILGESGVGKELVANAIHRLSRRSAGVFEAQNCGAIPEALFEAEMFGTEPGAYTGAVRRMGYFERANDGTLLLDEVGELVMANQVKLLRVLEGGSFHRVGSTEERRSNLRIIAATNRDLRRALDDGSFRWDLYYRLNVLQVEVPPLRQRREDIPLLVRHFAGKGLGEVENTGFSPDALARLSRYDWPGNIRELRNVVHRAAVCAENGCVQSSDIRFG